MRPLRVLVITTFVVIATAAAALAAATPKRGIDYFYVKHGSFSINLYTSSATRIASGKPLAQSVKASSVLIVCPAAAGAPVSELHLGFPGVKLKLSKHHNGFKVTYTERDAKLVVLGTPGSTSVKATVSVTGTVAKATLITGTVSVQAAGCNLRSSKFSAAPFKF